MLVITSEKEQSSNESVTVLVDYEMKVIGLVDWVIDAPVGNKLGIVPLATVFPPSKPITNFAVKPRNPAITQVTSTSRPIPQY